jgi:hypothetical protein
MADYDLILLSMAVALAGGYAGVLYVRYRHRARDYPAERQWPGHGIDATGISERVHRVRHDYVEALPLRPHQTGRRARILGLTRLIVGGSSYFRKPVSLSACTAKEWTRPPLAEREPGSSLRDDATFRD